MPQVNQTSLMDDYLKYVEQYRVASSFLPEAGTLFPNQQVRGLLIELAFKAYLCASEKDVRQHDLLLLSNVAKQEGLVLTPEDISNVIIPTNNIYFEGGPWNSRYLCRYPKPDRGTIVTLTPTHSMIDNMVQRIILQTRAKLFTEQE
ncbi:hypothetical protein Q4519_20600 [Motilimonas sp. 1_MG-2023]|uniref:hypothetical protein n=1 Tax=Motilimonas sp. 1_MG-2023 TaxID=3062672 RepID=UPI0026E43E92|nr:hypothetical protein [Motilimonas sp. 1_MG-2023]MDO6528079.1 hypothetical protein [Motilimonas sp. 1_MG-2023]